MEVLVRPTTKKNFVEIETYRKDDKVIRVETVFRGGSFIVDKDALPEDTSEDLDLNELEGEFNDCYDVWTVDYETVGVDEPEYSLFTETYEDDKWAVEDDLYWELERCDYYIEGGFEIYED